MLICTNCGQKFKKMKGLYWHLKCEHKYNHGQAFDSVSVAIRECNDDDFSNGKVDGMYWNDPIKLKPKK